MPKIAILPGDGIGPEVIAEAVKVLRAVGQRFGHTFELVDGVIGGASIDRIGFPIGDALLATCEQCDAVLFGAVGGPKWDHLPVERNPNTGLFILRKKLDAYANLRPAKLFPPLAPVSPLKNEVLAKGVDILIVRELTGGLYYGKRGRTSQSAFDTLEYTRREIERVVDMAFRLAQKRRRKVTSVDKSNVLDTSKLWREIAIAVGQRYPDVALNHLLIDTAAMRLIANPSDFDVIVTENTFGDILSDEAAVLAGSLGMLPSASIGDGKVALYEPVHGSAPDIAGKSIANPLAAILSVAMMLEYSFAMQAEAAAIERAVGKVLDAGYRTRDIATPGAKVVGTSEMGGLVAEAVMRNP
jgi:3-isopropylmalate dehydrogenase